MNAHKPSLLVSRWQGKVLSESRGETLIHWGYPLVAGDKCPFKGDGLRDVSGVR
jgi:hypothetical protein